MKRLVRASMLLALLVAPCLALDVPSPGGWTALEGEYRYGRETLWEYINGAAELFLNYQFTELVAMDFERGEAMITVCVYDMGFPIDAYGIFEAEKPKDAEIESGVGAAAVLQPPYQGLMIKDRYYVKIEVGGGDLDEASLLKALIDVAAALPGDESLPTELTNLPTEGRVPGTVAFAGSNYLGFADLSGCLHAEYEGGHQFFVMRPSSAFLRNERGKWTVTENGPHLTFVREIPYRGLVVLMGDKEQLVGVSGVKTMEEATDLLVGLH